MLRNFCTQENAHKYISFQKIYWSLHQRRRNENRATGGGGTFVERHRQNFKHDKVLTRTLIGSVAFLSPILITFLALHLRLHLFTF